MSAGGAERLRENRGCAASDLHAFQTDVPCRAACPVGTDIPGYIRAILGGDYAAATGLNSEANFFPAVLGRVCARPCEAKCRHGEPGLGQPVNICHLKRLAADLCGEPPQFSPERPPTGRSVGVVGAGPAGLAAASLLQRMGHRVVVYEMMPEPGGMLVYGIPAFRLPKGVVAADIRRLCAGGLDIRTSVQVGKDVSLSDLREKHDAVLLAAGCSKPKRVPIPGFDKKGVLSGLDFMVQVNTGQALSVGDRVMVLGGGFTAMDCARSARRLGAREVYVCIRTTEEDLYVTKEQIVESKREGVRFLNLVSTLSVVGEGRVEGVRFQYTRLGGRRPSGDRVSHPIEGSDFTLPADTVVAAIGQAPDTAWLECELKGPVQFDVETGRSGIPGLYAAGDFVRGARTVVEAVGHACGVVLEIDARMGGGGADRRAAVGVDRRPSHARARRWDFIPRTPVPLLPPESRFDPPDSEVEKGFACETGAEESRRCYQCDLKFEVDMGRCVFCRACMDVCPRKCIGFAAEAHFPEGGRMMVFREARDWSEAAAVVVDHARCIRCGLCAGACPLKCVGVARVVCHRPQDIERCG